MAAQSLHYFLLLTIIAGIIIGSNGSNDMMKVDAKPRRIWCIAKYLAPPSVLEAQIKYACKNGADCAPIKVGGKCFKPDKVLLHASYVFNSFYKRKGTCNFAGAGVITITDPSYKGCKYQ